MTPAHRIAQPLKLVVAAPPPPFIPYSAALAKDEVDSSTVSLRVSRRASFTEVLVSVMLHVTADVEEPSIKEKHPTGVADGAALRWDRNSETFIKAKDEVLLNHPRGKMGIHYRVMDVVLERRTYGKVLGSDKWV